MALTDSAIEELLEQAGVKNVPEKLKGRGLTGPREIVPVAEQRDRRETVAQMLASGISRDKIYEVMGSPRKPDGSPGFRMTQGAVNNLIREVYQTWSEEDAQDRPQKKALAARRIKRSIIQAKNKGAFTAVAQLERTLMQIEGTAEPLEINVNGLDRLSGALVNVLNVQSAADLQKLVESEEKYLKEHNEKPVLPSHVLDEEPVAVESHASGNDE